MAAKRVGARPAAGDQADGHGGLPESLEWTTLGLGIAGSLLAVSGLAALTSRRSRRLQRGRVTA